MRGDGMKYYFHTLFDKSPYFVLWYKIPTTGNIETVCLLSKKP